jgi:hypothetical protein
MGPDGIANTIRKHWTDILGSALAALSNCSQLQGTVPDVWKSSRVIPVPNTFHVSNVGSDIQPVAVTKVAESFVSKHFNGIFHEMPGSNQFGCVRSRSTTQALFQFMHQVFKAFESTDIIRVSFMDFR